MFSLHPRLEAGSFDFDKLGICRVLLKNNSLFPWFILVPEVDASIIELHQLEASDFASVCFTIRQLSEFVQNQFNADKINVATIGNQVSQLHIHVIARYTTDAAWPGVVWSHDGKQLYQKEDVLEIHQAYMDKIQPFG